MARSLHCLFGIGGPAWPAATRCVMSDPKPTMLAVPWSLTTVDVVFCCLPICLFLSIVSLV